VPRTKQFWRFIREALNDVLWAGPVGFALIGKTKEINLTHGISQLCAQEKVES